MPKPKCIICGKTKNLWEVKLPHGSFHICFGQKCADQVTVTVNSCSFPTVWVSPDDLGPDTSGLLTDKELEVITNKDIIEIARDTGEGLCNDDYFHASYQEALTVSIQYWREAKERELINDTSLENLPLIIEDIQYERNKKLLQERLKNEE